MIENILINITKNALSKLKIEADNVLVEIPRNNDFGDYATNVAFSLAKVLKKDLTKQSKMFL